MSLIEKITKAIREVPIELRRLGRGHYPNFVRQADPPSLGSQVPVFMFHTVEPTLFEAQVAFLRQNQYCTLTLAQFMDFLKGRYRLDGPSVLLTFDDGHKSWFEVAWPKLRKLGLHGVGFLVAGRIQDRPVDGPWLSWPEIRMMEASGTMTFESHTMRHDQVFTGAKRVDFVHPGFYPNPLGLDMPWIDRDGRYTNHLSLGTPIYLHASRLAGFPRMFDDIRLRRECISWVDKKGGADFFSEPAWRQQLKAHFVKVSNGSPNHQYETSAQMRRSIQDDMVEAREFMTEKLGRPVRHLCYPWGVGSDLAVELSREAGYDSNFWVVHPSRNSNRPGDDCFFIPRLKDDYIFRLPGKGRRSFGAIAIYKAQRRARKVNIY